MEKMNKNSMGLTFAFLFSFAHLVWSILIASGMGQVVADFLYNLHRISVPITVLPFDLILAGQLVVLTFVVGYIFGWLMAFFWNKCCK